MSFGNVGFAERGENSWLDPSLVDAQLADKGVTQALNSQAKQSLASIELDFVLVSPLRRCIQTAYYLLKDHKDF